MDQTKNRTDRKTAIRMILAFLFFILIASVIIGRLARYQIKEHDYYESQVLNQLTIQTDVTPERGTITDRNGVVLATNITVYNVILSPADIVEGMKTIAKKNSDSDKTNDIHYDYEDADYGIRYQGDNMETLIAETLSAYLDIPRETVYEKIGRTDRYYEVLKKNVDADLAERIEKLIADCGLKQQIYFNASSKRYYPKGDLACHVIGFTNSEGVGIYGLEAYYNNLLEGTSGRYILAQDARHNDMPFAYERFIEAENGYNITTTLDVYIQYELENQLKKTYLESGAGDRVCGMVVDTETCGILAMAVYPSFDLNDPYTIDEYSQAKLDAEELSYDSLLLLQSQMKAEGWTQEKIDESTARVKGRKLDPESDEYELLYRAFMYRMWNNKCVTETYEPGSTFKVVTTSMAFEEQLITPNTCFDCPGYWYVDGWGQPISCAEHNGHGMGIPFWYGLQQYCNPTLMQVAAIIGRRTFYDYFMAYGYGGRTGIDLPGEVGCIYSSYEDFSNVSLAVYSFGQTFKTTPIQQIRAITAVASGGNLMTPHLLASIVDDDGNVVQHYDTEVVRTVVSGETCDTITEILEQGVATDGAAKNAYVKGYRVAAKTGTSEKRDEYDEFGERPFRIGSTVAYAPADDPKIAALILVDKPLLSAPYGGTVAAPYISNLLSYVLPYIGVEPQYTTEELAKLDVTVPDYVGAPLSDALNDIARYGFNEITYGSGTTVTAQLPEGGSRISSDTGLLILYTDGEVPQSSVEVPDLKGLSAYVANNIAVSNGLNVTLYGSTNGSTATVINQSLEPGTWVPEGTIIQIELRHLDGND